MGWTLIRDPRQAIAWTGPGVRNCHLCIANRPIVVVLENKAKHIVSLRFENYHLSRNRPSFEYCLIHPGASSRPGKSKEWFPLGRGVLGRMDRRGVYGATWRGGDSNSCPCLYPETKRQSALLGVFFGWNFWAVNWRRPDKRPLNETGYDCSPLLLSR